MTTHLQKLKNELTTKPETMLFLAGIGVSSATCPGTDALSWKGLLKNGLERCGEIGVDVSRLDIEKAKLQNHASTPDDYVDVATFVTRELRKVREGVYGHWLSEVFKIIKPKNQRLVLALRSLGVNLSTTNYDHLIENVGGGTAMTWREPGRCSEFLRGQSSDVLHFHGSWLQPESVILGLKSYDDICNDTFTQNALKSYLTMKTMVFVGCGAGLEDPNFGTLLEWSRETLKHCRHDHFILVRAADVSFWRQLLHGLPIVPLSYGESYDELAPFIEKLAKDVAAVRERQDPSTKLLAAQSAYNENHAALELVRSELAPTDYLRQERTLALALRIDGGNRQAAISFSDAVTFHAGNITSQELVEFLLDAAEMLLDEDLAKLAANHLHTAERGRTSEMQPTEIARLNRLQIRCYAELSAYRQLLEAIARELPYADANRREELEAERDEASWLQGQYGDRRGERTET